MPNLFYNFALFFFWAGVHQCPILVLRLQCNLISFLDAKIKEQIGLRSSNQSHGYTPQVTSFPILYSCSFCVFFLVREYVLFLMAFSCRYIAAEHIPVKYGGLQRENDPDFSTKDETSEVSLKNGGTETIEIQAPKVNKQTL